MTVPVSWLLVALVILLLALWGWWRATYRITRGNRARQQHAQWGEAGAERVLAHAGYTVVDRQLTAEWTLWLDNEPVAVRCRADLLATRDGESFIAEVKTGARAINPTNPSTRRQLLEYQMAFPVDGVLLIDMEAQQVIEVYFDTNQRGNFIGETSPLATLS
ncbi:MAG: hypothetical protein GWP91_16260 [Rhodobacterales bacterium]|nr:hypothetical protein [Rhodobacterales bacterium]